MQRYFINENYITLITSWSPWRHNCNTAVTLPGDPKWQDWKNSKKNLIESQNVKALSKELQSSDMVVQQLKCNDKHDSSAGNQNIDEVTVHLL